MTTSARARVRALARAGRFALKYGRKAAERALRDVDRQHRFKACYPDGDGHNGTARRRSRESRWQHRYRLHPRAIDGTCFYCGRDASGLDHVPPLAAFDGWCEAEVNDVPCWLVPACWPCNKQLGPRPLLTLASRTLWLGTTTRAVFDVLTGAATIDEINVRVPQLRWRKYFHKLDLEQLAQQLAHMRQRYRQLTANSTECAEGPNT